MKKLLLLVAVAATMSFGACSGSKESKATEENENALKTKIENCTNPDSLSIYVQQAKEYADKLVKEGKVDQAKEYLDQLTPVVEKHAPSLAGTFAAIKTAVDQVPGAAKAAADSTKEAVTDSVSSKVEAAKDAASDAIEAGKAKAADAVSDAAGKASDAIKGSADKASDAIKNALK